MNRLQLIYSSRRIVEAARNSLSNSYKKSPISNTQLRRFSDVAKNGGDAGETTTQGSPHEPQPERPSNPRRKSRFDAPRDDTDFLEKFGLGIDNAKDESAEKPRRSEAESPANPPENADEIFKRMKENGLIPNAVAMLDGLCQDGLVQEAMKLFALMRERGTIPDVVAYTAVVEGFCRAEKPDDAVRVFRKMQSNGVVGNAFSYGVLVRGLCKCKRVEEAVGFCLEMLEAGHSPNVAAFVGLVEAVCEASGAEEGLAVMGKLRERGFLVNERAAREFLEKNVAFSPAVWEIILGKKKQRLF